jgi:hypothetical protein
MMKLVSVYCLVLGIVCPEQIVLVRLLNMQYYTCILYFWYYQIHFTYMNPDPVLTGSGLFSEVGSGSNRSGSATLLARPNKGTIF